METKTKNGLIAVGVTLGLAGLGYYLYTKYYKGGGNNFDSLLENLGSNVKPNKDNVVIVKFNNLKNFAQFYTNSRVIIFDSNKKIVVKGSYSDGGHSISLDNGKEINSGSVYGNLLSTLTE